MKSTLLSTTLTFMASGLDHALGHFSKRVKAALNSEERENHENRKIWEDFMIDRDFWTSATISKLLIYLLISGSQESNKMIKYNQV